MFDPLAWAAIEASRDLAQSALPDAPVRRDPRAAAARPRPMRRHTAAALRRFADRLEPAPRPSALTRTS